MSSLNYQPGLDTAVYLMFMLVSGISIGFCLWFFVRIFCALLVFFNGIFKNHE